MTPPDGLQPRGAALWEALGQQLNTPAGAVALEACRTADRLDELDSVIAGKGVLNLMQFRIPSAFASDDEVLVRVEFSNVLAEARQQSNALRQLLVSLGLDAAKPEPEKKGSPLDELANRRTNRITSPAGSGRTKKPGN